jgi:hypothetical protein
MKKIVTITIMLLVVVSCQQSEFGRGGMNAEQFVKENALLLRDDIASFRTVREDSLLSDIALSFGRTQLIQAGTNFLEGTISRDDYMKVINERTLLLKDIQDCWQFPAVVGDSLRRLSKYNGMWRKAYTVEVTMKSGVTKSPRVLMDSDGTTPRMMERDMMKVLDEYDRQIAKAIKYLSY